MILIRRYKETDIQFALREFNHSMSEVGRYHWLYYERIITGWRLPAIFYQQQSALWYERAVECRARYERALAELIPGTSVRWDDIFSIQYIQLVGRGACYKITQARPETVMPLKRGPNGSLGVTPKDRYDNPRDVPITLEQIFDQLKR